MKRETLAEMEKRFAAGRFGSPPQSDNRLREAATAGSTLIPAPYLDAPQLRSLRALGDRGGKAKPKVESELVRLMDQCQDSTAAGSVRLRESGRPDSVSAIMGVAEPKKAVKRGVKRHNQLAERFGL